MSEKAQTSKDRITKSAHEGIESASNAAHPTVDRAAAGAHRAVESADQFADQAGEAIGKAGAKGEELVDASTSYVREHPLLSMGLAVTAGYVLSTLLSSR
jgi:ElaB/YqjD/DUF883 family membrane-anchored ribosome-binding protein